MSRRIVASFDREDRVLSAVARARERGYPIADVYTPYPVHGIDVAMGIRPTRLGILCLVFGLTGVAISMGFQYWTHNVDWPINVGGRPFNAWPAYVPVSFEVMVLMAGIGTVLAFLVVSRLYPGRKSAVPTLRATDDLFVVVVEAREGAVDSKAVADFFRASGAVSAEEEEVPPPARIAWGRRSWTGPLAAVFLLVIALSWGLQPDTRHPNEAILTEMAKHVSYPSYAVHPDLPGGMAMQPPQEGSIARGRLPLHYGTTPEEAERAGRELASPFPAGDAVALQRGARVFANFCMVCHGPEAKGDGPVTKRGVPPPPSLIDGKAAQMPPGRIFHIITYGQGNMAPHAGQVAPEDRWAVIAHILNLQKR